MKHFLSIITLIIAYQTATAQIPSGYYDDAIGLTGSDLKDALHIIIDDHNNQSYSSLWTHFETTDDKPNGKVWDMYSDVPGGTPPYQYDFGSDQCGTYQQEGDCYNREHSFPGSWFNEAYPMYTDLFHLIPADGYVNGMRSNLPYGEVGSASWTSQNGSKRGSCSYPGYSGSVFEPIDEYKGDLARGYFYMATRYKDQFSSFSSPMISGGDFSSWAINLLIDWHQADPVSQKEIDRNNAIYSIQYNRNPYIDHPEFVECVWLGICNYAPQINDVVYSPVAPQASDQVTVTAEITDEESVSSATLVWGVNSTPSNDITMNNTTGDTYSASVPAQQNGDVVNFYITAIDNDDNETQSNQYSYTVGLQDITLIDEDFSNCPPGGWLMYSASCPDRNWECSSNGYMEVNAYGGSEPADEWLITPALNLYDFIDGILSFETWTKYEDSFYPPLTLKYSTDYPGEGNPYSATWTELSFNVAPENSETWTHSGEIDLSGISDNEVYVGFHYISSGNFGGNCALWEIDNVLLTASPSDINEAQGSDEQFRIYPNPANRVFHIINKPMLHGKTGIKILNTQYKAVIAKNHIISTNNNIITLNIQALTPGLYIVEIKNQGKAYYKKLLVK